MALKSFSSIVRQAKQGDSYWAEKAKLDVAIGIYQLMLRSDISNSQLAEKLGVKPPYVTKVLRGESNLTIESLVKLARAVGGKLEIHLADRNCDVRWLEVFDRRDVSDRNIEAKNVFASSRAGSAGNVQFPNIPVAANVNYEAESLSA